MSVKEVTLLRKSGNLKEAYKMAIDDLKEDRNCLLYTSDAADD